MATAKVFKRGRSQFVRIPEEYHLEASEVEIFREGDTLVLRPIREGLSWVLELLASFSDEVLERNQPPSQKR